MWSRKGLKENAKRRVSMNRWRAVLAALAFTVLCGGGGVFSTAGGAISGVADAGISEDGKKVEGGGIADANSPDIVIEDGVVMFAIVIFIIAAAIFLALLLIALPLKIFVLNPLEIGVSRFFTKNMEGQAKAKELCFAFDNHYKNCVKVEFFRKLHIFLWTLLLVVPGIVKSYEYQMVPYILGERPDLGQEEAFALSKAMMHGNKWKAFVLDLSFFGWYILSGLTLGILGVLYLNPYVSQTNAALYLALKGQQGKGDAPYRFL